MNIRLYFALIYFNCVIIYARQIFYKSLKEKKYRTSSKFNVDVFENNLKNSTNDTFMDDEEYMKLLRFYTPI